MITRFDAIATSRRFNSSRWLIFTLVTILLWGVWGFATKLVSTQLDTSTNQLFFTLGLLPLMVLVKRGSSTRQSSPRFQGKVLAFATGILGGLGNIAFFEALVKGGRISIVGPITALFPLVTVVLAFVLLHERFSKQQLLGFVFALIAIYLLVL